MFKKENNKLSYKFRYFINEILKKLNQLIGYRIWPKNQEPKLYE